MEVAAGHQGREPQNANPVTFGGTPRGPPHYRGPEARVRQAARLEHDIVAESVEAADEIGGRAPPGLLVEERLAEIAERSPAGQHVIGGDQDLMRDGDRGPKVTSPCLQPVVFVL